MPRGRYLSNMQTRTIASAVVASALLASGLSGCGAAPKSAAAAAAATAAPVSRGPAAAEVAALLAGAYTSAEQAKADPEFFEVELHMVPIWTDRADGKWLYVEQAMATALDKPYRQRIYHVVDAADGAAESFVFELPNAAERVGAWKTPAVFNADKAEALTKRDGCSIRLTRADDGWTGSTTGHDCPSALKGAKYATSEVKLFADRIETWDRGFNEKDQQVWGAKKGPYRFTRVN